jgi:oligopeptide transport system substrate-binding protein
VLGERLTGAPKTRGAASGTEKCLGGNGMPVTRGTSDRHHPCRLLFLGVAVGILGCSQPQTPAITAEILHRGLSGEPATLDPAAAADTFSSEVMEDLYEGLTTESPSGEIIPGVASGWTVDASGTRYTFQLRPDAQWSNGNSVRARDFIAAWQRALDPKQGSPVADDLRLILNAAAIIAGKSPVSALGVEAPSDFVLVVNLEQPAPYFLQLMAHSAAYPIYSDASARSHDPATWISNGAYVLAGWSPNTTVGLEKNVHYWNHSSVRIPRVEYVVTSDGYSQFVRYRAGALDMTDTVPENAVAELRRERSTEFVTAPFLATAYYGLNLTSRPCNTNLQLRQALTMAIDRTRLVASLGFGQAPAFGFVPPGTWNYGSQSWAWKDLTDADRIAEAKRLYAAAGYSSRTPLHLRLLFNSNPAIKHTAIVVASMWREILGIDTELVDEENQVFLQSRHDRSRWDVARLAWSADFNDASNFLDTLRTHSSNNDPGYVNTAFDELLDAAAGNADPNRRRELLERSERLMLADYPVVPLYFFVSKRLVKPYVQGVVSNPLNHIRSQTLVIQAR